MVAGRCLAGRRQLDKSDIAGFCLGMHEQIQGVTARTRDESERSDLALFNKWLALQRAVMRPFQPHDIEKAPGSVPDAPVGQCPCRGHCKRAGYDPSAVGGPDIFHPVLHGFDRGQQRTVLQHSRSPASCCTKAQPPRRARNSWINPLPCSATASARSSGLSSTPAMARSANDTPTLPCTSAR